MPERTPPTSERLSEPTPLSRLLDRAAHALHSSVLPNVGDGFLFAGNRHESVPRALFCDTRLTPIERNAWQVFRMALNDDGITAFPTYEQLRPYLSSTPCGGLASDETVARALMLLRLTRWLTLVRHQRDPQTGRIRGNLYVLLDEPLSPFEAIQLDPHYLTLVSQSLGHASKTIQRVAIHTLEELNRDPLLSGRILPSRLQVIAQRLAGQGWTEAAEFRLSDADAYDGVEPPSSDSEGSENASRGDRLRNPKMVSTVRTDNSIEEVRTVPRTRTEPHRLRLPELFGTLKPSQQSGALATLKRLEPGLQQAVLDEWHARCRDSPVRNPAGYLFGIIQKALQGSFNALVAPERRRGR